MGGGGEFLLECCFLYMALSIISVATGFMALRGL